MFLCSCKEGLIAQPVWLVLIAKHVLLLVSVLLYIEISESTSWYREADRLQGKSLNKFAVGVLIYCYILIYIFTNNAFRVLVESHVLVVSINYSQMEKGLTTFLAGWP